MKLLYVCLLSFVFIASSSLALYREIEFAQPNIVSVISAPQQTLGDQHFPPMPVLTGDVYRPELTAQAVYALDLDSYIPLYEKNVDNRYYPASTTKIITALVALDYYPLNSVITVGKVTVPGQKMNLVYGEQLTALDLLYGLLVYSANDAAEVLAQSYPGGQASFVEAMNAKALSLSMQNTNFSNPSGLDDVSQLTSARDLARAAVASMNNPTFRTIVGTKSKTITSVDGKIVHNLKNINELLGKVEGVKGIKTGWTENAKENLVSYVERNNKRVVIVVLGSTDRFGESTDLIDWVFGNFTWKEVDPGSVISDSGSSN